MVDTSLNRIEHWLASYAPRILHESLNPGAAATDLAALEAAIGRPLPEDFQALYRRHNGLNEDADNLGSFCYGMSLLPLAEMLAAYHQARQTQPSPLRQAAPTIKAAALQNPHWLRLGFDGSHAWLLVDLDPTEAGTYGQVLYLDEEAEIAFRVAGSVAELLATFADDLTQGHYVLDEEAADDGNEFLIPAAAITLNDWASTDRWRHAFTA